MYSDSSASKVKDFRFQIELYESCSPFKNPPREQIKSEDPNIDSKLMWEVYQNDISTEESE